MRVGQTGNNNVQGTDVSKSKHAGKSNATHASKNGGKTEQSGLAGSADVKAEISSNAREAALARTAATNAPDTREDKIAELKRRIAAGSYKVDAHAVADKLVDEHLKMSGMG